jgi:hypothetical protein
LPIIRRLQAENNKKAGYIICSFQLVSINMSVQWSERHIVRQMIWPVIKKYEQGGETGIELPLTLYIYSYRWVANNCNFKSSTAVIADIWWLLNIISSFSIEWRWWWWNKEQKHCLKKKSCMISMFLFDHNRNLNWISLTIFLMILNLEMHQYQLYEFDCLEDFYIWNKKYIYKS